MRRLAPQHGLILGILLTCVACVSDPIKADRHQPQSIADNNLSLSSAPPDQTAPGGSEAAQVEVTLTSDAQQTSVDEVMTAIPAVDTVWPEAVMDVEASEATSASLGLTDSEVLSAAHDAVENLSGWHGLPTTFEGEPLRPTGGFEASLDTVVDGDEEAAFDVDGPTPALMPEPGETLVRVESSIANAEVWTDGILLGPANEYLTLAPGQHNLEIRAVGFSAEQRSVSLSPRAKEVIRVELAPAYAH